MQPFQATGKRLSSLAAGTGRRFRLDEIGTSLTAEELLTLPLFMYLAMDGILHASAGFVKFSFYVFNVVYWVGTTLSFLRTRAQIHWELWTCRFAFIFLAFTVASITWGTTQLSVTIIPTITGVCTFLYYNYLFERFSLNDFTRMMVWAFAILLTLSIIASIAFPAYGIDDGSADPNNRGAWQGVFAQKNQLGTATAIALGVALGLRPKSSIDRIWRWLLIVVACICAYGSQSRESWIAMALELSFFVFMRLLRRVEPRSRPPILLAGLTSFVTLTVVTYLNLDAAFSLIGRTRTASHRTDIWEGCFLLIQKRPWLGYGTYGVWKTPVAWPIIARAQWLVTSSHNNYIETALSYGLVGLTIYSLLIGSAFLYIVRALLSYDLRNLEVPIYTMIAVFVLSFASPLVMYSPSVGMILLLYCISHLERVERSGFMMLDR